MMPTAPFCEMSNPPPVSLNTWPVGLAGVVWPCGVAMVIAVLPAIVCGLPAPS